MATPLHYQPVGSKHAELFGRFMSFIQGCLIYALLAFSSAFVHAQSSKPLELRELEALIWTCDKTKDGYELTICMGNRFLDLDKELKNLLNDDCRWAIWSKDSDSLCSEKAQYEGHGAFYSRRTYYCRIAQSLLLYGQLLDLKLGGQRWVDEKLLDLNIDPDSPQILPLQQLREKILDQDSKEIKCEQRPMV